MRIYLDMENSTLEINFKNIKNYDFFLSINYNSIIKYNFKRIIFHVVEQDIYKLEKIINKYFIIEIPLIIFKTKLYHKDIEIKNKNILLINNNVKNIVYIDNVYNLIELSDVNFDIIIKEINRDTNIIVDPIIDINCIKEFVNKLDLLFLNLKSKDINLNSFIIPSYLVREHPCNAYLCNGWNCGKKISCLPKHIYIKNDGNMYPHDLFYEKLLIGNIKEKNLNSILNKYFNSDNYNSFIKYNMNVFIKYLPNYPYDYFPLISYVKEEAKHDK